MCPIQPTQQAPLQVELHRIARSLIQTHHPSKMRVDILRNRDKALVPWALPIVDGLDTPELEGGQSIPIAAIQANAIRYLRFPKSNAISPVIITQIDGIAYCLIAVFNPMILPPSETFNGLIAVIVLSSLTQHDFPISPQDLDPDHLIFNLYQQLNQLPVPDESGIICDKKMGIYRATTDSTISRYNRVKKGLYVEKIPEPNKLNPVVRAIITEAAIHLSGKKGGVEFNYHGSIGGWFDSDQTMMLVWQSNQDNSETMAKIVGVTAYCYTQNGFHFTGIFLDPSVQNLGILFKLYYGLMTGLMFKRLMNCSGTLSTTQRTQVARIFSGRRYFYRQYPTTKMIRLSVLKTLAEFASQVQDSSVWTAEMWVKLKKIAVLFCTSPEMGGQHIESFCKLVSDLSNNPAIAMTSDQRRVTLSVTSRAVIYFAKKVIQKMGFLDRYKEKHKAIFDVIEKNALIRYKFLSIYCQQVYREEVEKIPPQIRVIFQDKFSRLMKHFPSQSEAETFVIHEAYNPRKPGELEFRGNHYDMDVVAFLYFALDESRGDAVLSINVAAAWSPIVVGMTQVMSKWGRRAPRQSEAESAIRQRLLGVHLTQ